MMYGQLSYDAGLPARLVMTDQVPKGDELRSDAVVQVDPIPDQPTDDAS